MDLRNLAFRVQFEGKDTNVVKLDKAVDDLKKSVGGTTKDLKNMGKSLKDNTKTESVGKLGKSTNKVGKAFDEIKKKSKFAFKDMKKDLEDFSKKANKLGKNLTKKITLPVVGLGVAGTKMALDLDNSIRKVTTLADRDILPTDKIKKEVREISDASGIAQTEIAESVYSALSAGVDSTKVMKFVSSGIDLTRAGFTDMETVIDATTTVLNAYGKNAYDVSKIHDIFVQTQDKGKISVDELGKNIGRVIPTASSLGVNLDQLGASYAILTSKGQNANLATTNLNAMLDELGKTGSSADKALRKTTGKSFAQLTADGKNVGEVLGILETQAKKSGLSLKDMFGSGSAGSAAVTLLSNGVEGYNKSLADMDGATGKTAENAKTMEDGLLKIQRATTQVKNALIDAGGIIAPYIELAATKVSELVGKFNQLDDGAKKNIMKFVGLAAITGPVISGIGKLAGGIAGIPGKIETARTAFSVLGKGMTLFKGGALAGVTKGIAFLASPVGIATVAIGALVAGGVALYKNWDKVSEWAGKTGARIKQDWEDTKGHFVRAWNDMKDASTKAMDKIKDGWEGLKEFVKNPIKGTVDIARNIKDKFTGKQRADGSHATGINYIPKDNYLGNLHKGEMVLTKKTSDRFRELGGTKDNVPKTLTRNIANNSTSNTNTTNNSTNNEIYNNYRVEKVKEVESSRLKEMPNITFSPTYNIEVKGNATEKEASDLLNKIDKKTRETVQKMFYEFILKMS